MEQLKCVAHCGTRQLHAVSGLRQKVGDSVGEQIVGNTQLHFFTACDCTSSTASTGSADVDEEGQEQDGDDDKEEETPRWKLSSKGMTGLWKQHRNETAFNAKTSPNWFCSELFFRCFLVNNNKC